jgi:hypothetical protein
MEVFNSDGPVVAPTRPIHTSARDPTREVGLDGVLSQGGRQPAHEVALCIAMMVARLIDPSSKLAMARLLDAETANCSLGRPPAGASG